MNTNLPRGVHEPTNKRRAKSFREATKRIGMDHNTAEKWKVKGLFDGCSEVVDGDVWWFPTRMWKAFQKEQERRAQAVPGVKRPDSLADYDADDVDLVRRRPVHEAKKIREQAERERYEALTSRRKYELMVGQLVFTESVKDAFRELAGHIVTRLSELTMAAWVDPALRADAERDIRELCEQIEEDAQKIRLERPEME